jgi:hypothetical protein
LRANFDYRHNGIACFGSQNHKFILYKNSLMSYHFSKVFFANKSFFKKDCWILAIKIER